MKATKIMLVLFACFISTALFVGLVSYLLSDDSTYKQCVQSPGLWLFMLVLGWIPCVILGIDLDEKLD